MRDVHFSNLDLNLLRVFDALMQEAGVTRAGARLGLTQSAVSHALGRLRFALQDDLFVRGATGMQPTLRALEIAPAVRSALAQLESALGPVDFAPAVSQRRFTLVAGPYGCAVIVPGLVASLRAEAPQLSLAITTPGARLTESLDAGRVDAAVGVFENAPERLALEPLLVEHLVWVVRRGHPALERTADLQALAALAHVVIARTDPMSWPDPGAYDSGLRRRSTWEDAGAFERALGQAGLARQVGVIVPDTFSALAIAARSDMAALLPRRLAELSIQSGRVGALDSTWTAPPLEISLLYRRDRAADPAVGWLLTRLRQVCDRL